MMKGLYTKLMRLYCTYILRSHRFEPVLQINKYRVVKLMLCSRCKLDLEELRND